VLGEEGALHVGGLVVTVEMVVSTYEQVLDLAQVEEFCGGVDAVFEVRVVAAVAPVLAGAEEQAIFAGRDGIDAVIDAAFAGLLDEVDAEGEAGGGDEEEEKEEEKEFSHYGLVREWDL
jgi:hypothetical protein